MDKDNKKPGLARQEAVYRQTGFSMLGTMIGILLVGVVSVGASLLYADYKQDQVARGRGKQLGDGLAQLDSFARRFHGQLTAGQAIAGVANTASPTTAELQALGFSAAGFADASQPGGPIVFRIVREPAGCAATKCILSLTAVTGSSVLVKGNADASFAQKIAGYVPAGAGWSNLTANASRLGKNGVTIPNPLGAVPAIAAAVAWLGNNQASQTVPPVSYNYRSLSCGTGYTGSREQQQSVSTDKWGNTTVGVWVTYTDDCAETPPLAPPVVSEPVAPGPLPTGPDPDPPTTPTPTPDPLPQPEPYVDPEPKQDPVPQPQPEPQPVPVRCGPWKEVNPLRRECYYETSDYLHEFERTCSDGSIEYDSILTNVGPCGPGM